MSKIIKLTEADLTRIVRRVISEQTSKNVITLIKTPESVKIYDKIYNKMSSGIWKKKSGWSGINLYDAKNQFLGFIEGNDAIKNTKSNQGEFELDGLHGFKIKGDSKPEVTYLKKSLGYKANVYPNDVDMSLTGDFSTAPVRIQMFYNNGKLSEIIIMDKTSKKTFPGGTPLDTIISYVKQNKNWRTPQTPIKDKSSL
jgi:hypothetical protein